MLGRSSATFTEDWFSHHACNWRAHLGHLADRPVDYLEIGSFEGRSALFVCDLLPKSRLTCVDLWPPKTAAAEPVFDANTASLAHRIRKIKGRSVAALDLLWSEQAKFDVIYIDGNHTRWYTFADTVLAWPLLRIGGLMIFDDYLLNLDKPREERCKDAVDLFHKNFAECMTVLACRWQVIVRKTSDWPEKSRPKLGPSAKRTPMPRFQRRIRKLRRRIQG